MLSEVIAPCGIAAPLRHCASAFVSLRWIVPPDPLTTYRAHEVSRTPLYQCGARLSSFQAPRYRINAAMLTFRRFVNASPVMF